MLSIGYKSTSNPTLHTKCSTYKDTNEIEVQQKIGDAQRYTQYYYSRLTNMRVYLTEQGEKSIMHVSCMHEDGREITIKLVDM